MKKRPPKAAKSATKGNAKPAKVRLLGGAGSAKKTPLDHWEKETEGQLEETFEAEIGRIRLNPELAAKARKNWPDYLPKRVEEMAAIRAEKAAAMSEAKPAEGEIRRGIYDSLIEEGKARVEAERGLEKCNSSQTGLDAARVDLAEQEAGADIAAEIAEKVYPSPKKEGSKDRKADARFQLSQGLEDLGWWLAEVPQGSREARWRAILPGNFNDEDRYSSDARSATRWTLSMTAAIPLIEDIATRLKPDQDKSGRTPPILEILDSNREEVRAFLERFFQRVEGNRAEALRRRQQTAEALAHGTTPPQAEGQKGSKTLENDLAWIRKQERPLFSNSEKKTKP